MGHGYRQLLAGVLLTGMALPACAAITVTTETMTGTGLPPGQTLPETPQQETAPAEPFTPRTVSASKMEAWGPLSSATSSGSATDSPSGSDTTTPGRKRPAVRRSDRMRPHIREVPPKEIPAKEVLEKKVPEKEVPRIVNPVRKMP